MMKIIIKLVKFTMTQGRALSNTATAALSNLDLFSQLLAVKEVAREPAAEADSDTASSDEEEGDSDLKKVADKEDGNKEDAAEGNEHRDNVI